jgi:oxygen-dependent protoporphyrinogen oxidase
MLPARTPGPDESVAQHARRRLGRQAAERLVDPIVAGIYAGDPEATSAAALGPMASGGASRGAPRMLSFRAGMGRLVEALTDALDGAVRLESPVERLARTDRGWRVDVGGVRGGSIDADAVVVAAPSPVAWRLLAPHHPALDDTLSGIPTVPVAVVALGYEARDVRHPLDGFGYLVPTAEGALALGVQWTTSMFPGARAPEGCVQLQVFLGGTRQPQACGWSFAALRDAAIAEVAGVLGIKAPPVEVRVFRHGMGLPQYRVGHAARVARALDAVRELDGLFLCGNAFQGVGVNACTAMATATAERACRHVLRRAGLRA